MRRKFADKAAEFITKKVLIILLVATLVFVLIFVGCGTAKGDLETDATKFVRVYDDYCYYIVYNKETKVMYAVSNCAYNVGTFTALLNADGTPQVWEE